MPIGVPILLDIYRVIEDEMAHGPGCDVSRGLRVSSHFRGILSAEETIDIGRVPFAIGPPRNKVARDVIRSTRRHDIDPENALYPMAKKRLAIRARARRIQ